MNLGECPDCKREISLRAAACPHCGCPSPFSSQAPLQFPSFLTSRIPAIFGIDPRTLALFRVAIALVLLYDLAGRVVDVRAFYSDEGIVTVAQQKEVLLPWLWSVNFLNGSVGFQTAIFIVAFVFAAALLVGLGTRLMTIGCWVLAVSIHVRGSNSLINGGDILLTSMLFWAMFLPLGKVWSIDSIWGKSQRESIEPVVSIASVAILLQIFFMYFFSGIWKLNDLWYSGQALEKALSYEIYVKPFGKYLLDYTGLLSFLTFATLLLELVGPFLFFSPWKTVCFRMAAWTMFMLLHIAIEMTMTVALFSCMSMAALTLFLHAGFWDWLKPSDKVIREKSGGLKESQRSRGGSGDGGSTQIMSVGAFARLHKKYKGILISLRNGFVGFILLFVLLWNINNVAPIFGFRASQAMLRLANLTSLNQVWFMFDFPDGVDTWYVAEAHLKDGSRVDVLNAGAPVRDGKPGQLHTAFRNHRWKMLFTRLSIPAMATGYGAVYRDGLVDYLRREWDGNHSPHKEIVVLNLLGYTERRLLSLDEYPVTLTSSGEMGHGNFFRKGKRQGHWKLLDGEGNRAEGGYINNMRDGLWAQWYPNGQKKIEVIFHNDMENGLSTQWRPDGTKMWEGSYRDGQYDGKWKIWNKEGELAEIEYRNGIKIR